MNLSNKFPFSFYYIDKVTKTISGKEKGKKEPEK